MGFSRSVRIAWLGCALAFAVSCQSADTHPIGDTRPARACPAFLDLELDARDSRFDPGFTGAAHGIGLANGSNLTVEVYAHDAECRRLRFRGPVHPAAANPIDPQRCLGKLTQTCTTDADCAAANAGKCRFLFPPISSTIVGNATCALAHFEPDAAGDPPVEGVFDLDSGEMDMDRFDLNIGVFLGACTTCQGDPTTFDGVAGGTCGAGSGAPACDVIGIGASTTSYDCPIGGQQLTTISLPGTSATTGTHVWKLDSTRSKCTSGTGSGTQPCWCGMCGDGTACVTTADCKTGACGVGSAGGVTYNTANNSCGSNGPCVWDDATQVGKCMKDATHRCYPDSQTQEIVAEGEAEVNDGFYTSQIANFTCLPAIGGDLGPIIDQVGGFPGPLLFQARFHVTARGGT